MTPDAAATVPGRLRNLTPHVVDLFLPDGRLVSVAAEPGLRPRLAVSRAHAFLLSTEFGEIPVTSTSSTGVVSDLPDAEHGTWLIVARTVVAALPSRADLLFPEDLVREPATGRVIGCRALGQL